MSGEGGGVDALGGLRVLDLSRGYAGALATLVLADYGAEVVRVDPPRGDPLYEHPAAPFWLRGKKSVVLDLRTDEGRVRARALAASSDVLLETFRPGVAERLGLGADELLEQNPRLIHASITGFGTRGPYAALKGYEGIVLAKLGGMRHVEGMAPRRGPAFPAAPYASFGAAQCVLHGILAALYVRGRTGRGQKVEASLVQGMAAHDPWDWFLRIVCERFPEAYDPAPPYTEDLVPNTSFAFRLLVCLTRDGRWLQFSQTSPHLFEAFLRVLGLDWMKDDPRWHSAPEFADASERVAFWEKMLEAARRRTVAEWDEVFAREPNVWAELFRRTEENLDHPQMRHNGHVIDVDDPRRGSTVQLAPLVRMTRTPGRVRAPAPVHGEHTEEILSRLDAVGGVGAEPGPVSSEMPRRPLDGVTALELGGWYAAPYGTALLADLGARVIKIEPPAGEPMRSLLPFPDAGAIKVLQGKESVALALERPEARAIVHQLAARSDLVLVGYRGGVAARLGVDCDTLRRINPRLVYLSAPGYGDDGPCARKPAFAPTMGVAAGVALYQAGPSLPEGPDLTLEEIKPASIRLNYAAQAPGNADGCSALGVATALLLGLVARERTGECQDMLTSMLCTTSYLISDDMIRYAGKPPRIEPDPMLYGFGALYRLYEARDGWVFLAAPEPEEWEALDRVLETGLARDPRFATAESRRGHDAALAGALAAVLATRTAREWEALCTAADVACVEVATGPISRAVMDDAVSREAGFLCEVEHPSFGRHRRMAPLVGLSLTPGSAAPAALLGQHTEAVLRELGHGPEEIAELERDGVIVTGRAPSLASESALR